MGKRLKAKTFLVYLSIFKFKKFSRHTSKSTVFAESFVRKVRKLVIKHVFEQNCFMDKLNGVGARNTIIKYKFQPRQRQSKRLQKNWRFCYQNVIRRKHYEPRVQKMRFSWVWKFEKHLMWRWYENNYQLYTKKYLVCEPRSAWPKNNLPVRYYQAFFRNSRTDEERKHDTFSKNRLWMFQLFEQNLCFTLKTNKKKVKMHSSITANWCLSNYYYECITSSSFSTRTLVN